ncbi:Hypothetical protein MPV1_46 [Marinitoga phage MPV1]|uniref:Uncharacterized protein n=1 Tax=Marinitoga piezophila (strain DSM 14283 / JCM 11233 / KA3) TaxID=443254 RepID=H2J4D9_MARPK|nr:hypothetical protein [Marinitoga piezophila]AEX84794.1 hypothetical protein Marpi_0344 [Marinitoga piezophila KA3]
MNLNDLKLWLVIAAGIIALILPFAITELQHSEQSKVVVEQYLNQEEDTTIDVYVYSDSWEEAKQILAMKYPGYIVEEYVYIDNKKSFLVRLKKIEKVRK